MSPSLPPLKNVDQPLLFVPFRSVHLHLLCSQWYLYLGNYNIPSSTLFYIAQFIWLLHYPSVNCEGFPVFCIDSSSSALLLSSLTCWLSFILSFFAIHSTPTKIYTSDLFFLIASITFHSQGRADTQRASELESANSTIVRWEGMCTRSRRRSSRLQKETATILGGQLHTLLWCSSTAQHFLLCNNIRIFFFYFYFSSCPIKLTSFICLRDLTLVSHRQSDPRMQISILLSKKEKHPLQQRKDIP